MSIETAHSESPVVTLRTGRRVSRFLVKQVMIKLKLIVEDMQNGAILLNDLVMKCHNEEHTFFDGSQWKLAELGFLDTNGQVIDSMREIVLAAITQDPEGLSDTWGLTSPIA